MKLNAYTRLPLDPFQEAFYVLCKEIILNGMHLKFRDKLPDGVDLFHLHTHFNNGAVGTKTEIDSLNAPVTLYQEDPLLPIANFIAFPDQSGKEQVEELNTETEDVDGNKFSLENADLLKTKDDLVGYANEFGIKLKKANNITISAMRNTLEEEAIKKGLIE